MGEFRDKVIEKTVRMFIGYERGCNYIIHVYIYITIYVYIHSCIYTYIYIGSGTFLYNCPSVFRLTCTVLVDVVGDVVNPFFFFNVNFDVVNADFFFLRKF